MNKKLIVFFSLLVFIVIISLVIFNSGYELPNKNKHPEIPFFPRITNENDFTNRKVDSFYVNSYSLLKKSNLLLINYDKDTVDRQSTSLAIVNKSFKSIFHFKTTDYLHYTFDEKTNSLFLIENTGEGIKKGIIFNINLHKTEFIHELNEKAYENLKEKLKVIKHFTPNGNFTEAIFFVSNGGQFYIAKNELASRISKDMALTAGDNFNFLVSIVMAGDTSIHSNSIQLFDKTVISNRIKRLIVIGTPSSNSSDSKKPMIDEDKGWFSKSRYYFFKIKFNKTEVKFKTHLFYNSDVYFDELSEPKTSTDTLLYYAQNRFYQFYKKR
ncbi:hypothetical protein [Pedobacter xixiisoli]|uniref:Uncharacterized protein n=1 Tax=Pedobacter xixiisoli TaxID=1476464 RepID=A0A285ZUK2_9SPHI|nr:hypothetical protein [Pedobacter xixiisoli]SOD13329.1 hypothetical protein SAMN06297358_1156 [Pedobacter xixiisoli]